MNDDDVKAILERLGADGKHWRIERRVPVALISVFLAQLAAGIWFASAVVTQVNIQTGAITKNTGHRESTRPHGEADLRLARLEAIITTLAEATKESTKLQTKILINLGRLQGIDVMKED